MTAVKESVLISAYIAEMITIPEDLTDFLYWVKERTEAFWNPPIGDPGMHQCADWIRGARWKGLSNGEIDAIEIKFDIKFTPEHRLFLSILHAIDRKEKIEYTETFDDDAPVLIEERPFFYHWQADDAAIREALDWPSRTIWEDIIGPNKVWLRSWGARPADEPAQKEIFDAWYRSAPLLIPIKGHRFIVSDMRLQTRPVLSIWGSDTIVYGWDLRGYLLKELEEHLDINVPVFDEEDQTWYTETITEVKAILEEDYRRGAKEDIPYWKEMILIWSSGWSSFCMNPYEQSGIQPIVKTYAPEDDSNEQKIFNSYKDNGSE
ncbi:hypothetical protein [Taibaiella koreensis]|uniref:hypothetical protein n=1 Tax=Taibaiella koreensis TaxID=1268548 RepID=UPI000E59B61B|nr:hypothetical protein [Taibaiella koreensis]